MNGSSICCWIRTFFVQAAAAHLDARWRQIFNLCWDGKGFTVDLTKLPDDVLDLFSEWRDERVAEENAAANPK